MQESREQVSVKESAILGLFKDADWFAFGYKKAERLSCALYILTDPLPETELLRNALRSRSLEILALVSTLAALGIDRETGAARLSALVLEIAGLLQVAAAAKALSPMNTAILSQEYAALAVFIREELEPGPLERLIAVEDSYAEALAHAPQRPVDGQPLQVYATQRQPAYKGHKMEMSYKMSDIARSTGNTAAKKDTADPHSGRRSKILGLFKDHPSLTIKDISRVIRDCGEKTIQRELLRLIAEGVLKKEGERRWSSYSLNMPKIGGREV